ncbi:MAG: DUF502 domain-containing protein [Burkholderiaceae bacterium]|nr:DUF502 domain-containing protein [Burkholderiaceae bacterium]
MIKRYFVTGLLLWVPIGITLWVLGVIVTAMDLSLALLPERWTPRFFIGRDIPGIGALLTLLVIFLTGVLTTNLVGGKLVEWGERLLARIPIVRSIYSSVKQVSDTILSPTGNAFRKALLVQYPRKDAWTIAFLTGVPSEELREAAGLGDAEMVSVYVPTTPNPTSGFFLMMRKADTVELDMTVDAALKYIVSMGVVGPVTKEEVRTRTLASRGTTGESTHA